MEDKVSDFSNKTIADKGKRSSTKAIPPLLVFLTSNFPHGR